MEPVIVKFSEEVIWTVTDLYLKHMGHAPSPDQLDEHLKQIAESTHKELYAVYVVTTIEPFRVIVMLDRQLPFGR
ncbi:hypothetical protein PBAL39_17051 [Pedobacter sp. BAL39]|nr:hypothetical protein PBAL39_17051 [Pedobacter sp. BAL39]